MRDLINWEDRVVEYPHRYEETTDSSGYVTHTAAPGEVEKMGTPQNATNFNIMDMASLEAMLMASEATRKMLRIEDSVDGLEGEEIEITLTNGYEYPHNNSQQTVQLSTLRNTTDYTVECEVQSVIGNGGVGHFEVTEKLVNGFKIAFTGGVSQVNAKCHVRGGL